MNRILVKNERNTIAELPLAVGVIAALAAPHLTAIELIELVKRHSELDKLALPIQKGLLTLISQPAQRGCLKHRSAALDGTRLGDALHRLLSDIPIGAWTGTTLLDIIWLTREGE